jgi:hypothetical protein
MVETTSLLAASGFRNDVGLFNAGEVSANCSARVVLADGTQVGPVFALTVAPLSFTLYEHIPQAFIGSAQVSNARLSMRCDQKFFVLSRTLNPLTGYVSFHTPATAIGHGFPDPGTQPTPTPSPTPPAGSPPPATAVETYSQLGSFYTPSVAEPQRQLTPTFTPNVAFKTLHVTFELEHGGWNAVNPEAVLNLLWLTRGDFYGDTFASITARGPGRNVVRTETTIDLPQGQAISRSKTTLLEPGKVYTFDYLYDHPNGTFTLTVSDDLGPLKIIKGPTTGPVWTRHKTWTLLLSEAPREGHAPNYGWKYSDLVITLTP